MADLLKDHVELTCVLCAKEFEVDLREPTMPELLGERENLLHRGLPAHKCVNGAIVHHAPFTVKDERT